MKPKKYIVKAVKHSGLVEIWTARTLEEWIDLARETEHQWLLNCGIDPDTLDHHDAIWALTHDYQAHSLREEI